MKKSHVRNFSGRPSREIISREKLFCGGLFCFLSLYRDRSDAAGAFWPSTEVGRALPEAPAVPAGAQLVLLRCEVAVGVERGLGLVVQLDAGVRRVLVGARRVGTALAGLEGHEVPQVRVIGAQQ